MAPGLPSTGQQRHRLQSPALRRDERLAGDVLIAQSGRHGRELQPKVAHELVARQHG
jgi:hypothetical protein